MTQINIDKRLSVYNIATLILCLFCLALISGTVLSINGLGPIDDHQFARTLFQGKSFGVYIIPELGRFFPLLAQEYVFVSKIINATPFLFYTIGAIKVFLAGLLLLVCLRQTRTGNLAIVGAWSVVIFSIAFGNAATRLQIGELNVLILVLIFIYSILFLEDKESSNLGKHRFLLTVGLLAMSISFFYKELSFVFALIFAIVEIARKYRQGESPIPVHLWILLAVASSYLSFYGLWRVFYVTGSYASFSSLSVLELACYYAENDPFIVFVVVPLAIFRLFYCIRNAAEQTVFDSMLFTAIAYFTCYLVLGMFTNYYLLPAYGFAACGIAGILRLKFVRIAQSLILLLICVFAVNNLPVTISDMQTLKMTANNHYRFVKAASEWINSHPLADATDRRTLVLVGVSAGTGVEIFESLKQFLILFGTPESAFSIRPTEPSDNKKISDFYGLRAEEGYKPVKGDLLIFNPYTLKQVYPPLQSPSYQEVHRSESTWAVPRWTAWNWLNICLLSSTSCETRRYAQRRLAGYTAMSMTRTPASPDLRRVESPAYNLTGVSLPLQLKKSRAVRLEVTVRNTGVETWPANGSLLPGPFVHLAYRWLNFDGDVVLEGNRFPFPEPIQPNDSVKVEIVLTTPRIPGNYSLQIRPVQEGLYWFPGPAERQIEVY